MPVAVLGALIRRRPLLNRMRLNQRDILLPDGTPTFPFGVNEGHWGSAKDTDVPYLKLQVGLGYVRIEIHYMGDYPTSPVVVDLRDDSAVATGGLRADGVALLKHYIAIFSAMNFRIDLAWHSKCIRSGLLGTNPNWDGKDPNKKYLGDPYCGDTVRWPDVDGTGPWPYGRNAWTDLDSRRRDIAAQVYVAGLPEVRDNPCVWLWECKNEPQPAPEAANDADIRAYYREVIAAVSQVNPHLLYLVGGNGGYAANKAFNAILPERTDCLYTCDLFNYTIYQADGVTLDVAAQRKSLLDRIQQLLRVRDAGYPILVQQAGCNLESDPDRSTFTWLMQTLLAFRIPVFQWELRRPGDGPSVFGWIKTDPANPMGADILSSPIDEAAMIANAAAYAALHGTTLNGVNGAPVARGDAYSTAYNTSLAGDLSRNDTPSPGGGNLWLVTTPPAHGTLVLDLDGAFTYSPTRGYSGPDTFTYKIRDLFGTVSGATVNLSVAGAPPAAGAPLLLYTDATAGMTGSNGINTENNLGTLLSLYLLNAGAFADWGVTSHVTIGGVEVANYRHLSKAVGSGLDDLRGVYETLGVKELCVQVGALPTLVDGTAYDIAVVVNGRTLGNRLSPNGHTFLNYVHTGFPLTFTPQPGTALWVSPTGNDANPGTKAQPLRTLQGADGVTGALRMAGGATGAAALTGTKPGTHVFLMPGEYKSVGSWGPVDASNVRIPGTPAKTPNDGMAANLFRISGTAPTGQASQGPIRVTRWPCAAGANTPGRVLHRADDAAGGSGSGGFLSNDQDRSSAKAGETCPYDGKPGWGRWFQISNIAVIAAHNGPRDGAPFNANSSSDDWLVTNCEMVWESDQPAGQNGAKGGGIAGNGYRFAAQGNWIHDIGNGDHANQNHGIYVDSSYWAARYWYNAFNCVQDITGGNVIQSYANQGSVAGRSTITEMVDNNNWLEGCNKHVLNCSTNTEQRLSYNNVCLRAGEALAYFDAGAVKVAKGLAVFNNVFVDWGEVIPTRAALWSPGGTGTGSLYIGSNIIMRRTRCPSTSGPTSLDNGGTYVVEHCRWFDAKGLSTARPGEDHTGSVGDPGFVDANANNFELTALSACLDGAVAPPIARVFDFKVRAVTGTPDIGAFERVVA